VFAAQRDQLVDPIIRHEASLSQSG
jgi:hypothetical protein